MKLASPNRSESGSSATKLWLQRQAAYDQNAGAPAPKSGAMTSPLYGATMPLRRGTEPSTFWAERKPMRPIIARRPLLISMANRFVFCSGVILDAHLNGSCERERASGACERRWAGGA